MTHDNALIDYDYRDEIIDKVEESETGYALGHGGWTLWCPKVEGVTPKVGDVLRTWGNGIGFAVRGIAINGQIVRYETRQEMEDRNARELAEREMEQLVSHATGERRQRARRIGGARGLRRIRLHARVRVAMISCPDTRQPERTK